MEGAADLDVERVRGVGHDASNLIVVGGAQGDDGAPPRLANAAQAGARAEHGDAERVHHRLVGSYGVVDADSGKYRL